MIYRQRPYRMYAVERMYRRWLNVEAMVGSLRHSVTYQTPPLDAGLIAQAMKNVNLFIERTIVNGYQK